MTKQSNIFTNLTLLYIEDDDFLRSIVVRFLNKYVENLYIADSGRAGIEVFLRERPNLIISDIEMPGMNGLEMIEEIKAVAAGDEPEFIILTAYQDTKYLTKAIELSISHYLVKPIKEEKLYKKLKKIDEEIEVRNALKIAKNQLEEYKRAIDESSLVSIMGRDGKILYVNPLFTDVLGYTKEEVVGCDRESISPLGEDERLVEEICATLHKKETWHGRIEKECKEGRSVILDSVIVPLLNESGEVYESIIFQHDITKEIEQERALKKLELLQHEREIDRALDINHLSLIEEMPLDAILCDEKGDIKEISKLLKSTLMLKKIDNIAQLVEMDMDMFLSLFDETNAQDIYFEEKMTVVRFQKICLSRTYYIFYLFSEEDFGCIS